MNSTPEFRLSSDSKALAQELAKAATGDVMTYADLSAIVGRDVQEAARSALNTARHVVQREHRIVFDVVIGVGLRRLESSEIVDLSDKARDRTRSIARRISKKLTCVEYDELPREKQTKHNAALSMFGLMKELASDGAQKRIEHKVENAALPSMKTAIEALRGIA